MKAIILSNVYCSNCKGAVSIIDFTIELDKTDLVLRGKCTNCSNEVVRLIEGNE